MTNSHACRPCAKRKVRCDQRYPCSNCRRRQTDRCVYSAISPNDRIKRLEAQVRNLGGDPDGDSNQRATVSATVAELGATRLQAGLPYERPKSIEFRSHDPVVVVEDGQSLYLESRAWQSFPGDNDRVSVSHNSSTWRPSASLYRHPHVFEQADTANELPDVTKGLLPQQAELLWDIFMKRVEPLTKICFTWQISQIRAKAVDSLSQQVFSTTEDAFISSVYLASIRSLNDEECECLMQEARPGLLAKYQMICEQALQRTGIFCMTNMTVIKAVTLYMTASFDRLNTHSLWSLMGLTIRNAEKLGLHRDGILLGLPPAEIEDRRRLWWQLQHMDLFLAVRCGVTPMTLMADWDCKMPLNIEDQDVSPTSVSPPEARKGLTSMSYCLFTYCAIDQQRRVFQSKNGRFTLSWQANISLPMDMKDSIVTELEDTFNKSFLQYCDPIKPLDLMIQLVARFLIAVFQLKILHPIVCKGGKAEDRAALVEISMKCLRYNIALHTPLLAAFQWRVEGMFPWHALMYVLVEATHEEDRSRAHETWDLLASVYASNAHLFDFAEDRRKFHAAELVVSAWKFRSHSSIAQQSLVKPGFIAMLESGMASYCTKPADDGDQAGQNDSRQNAQLVGDDEFLNDVDKNTSFDLDFQDIDWSFWNSMD